MPLVFPCFTYQTLSEISRFLFVASVGLPVIIESLKNFAP